MTVKRHILRLARCGFAVGLLIVGTSLAGPLAQAAEDEAYQYDPENALDIMELCAGCHGDYGQGGGGGEYPRLAGLPAKYLATQMRAFKHGERASMAMAPYADEREMPEADLLDISTYLAGIELPTVMPYIDPDLSSYDKLLLASRVFNVPRLEEGDPALGEGVYARQCKKCHGKKAAGRGSVPQLTGQYSDYIRLQIQDFREGKRVNKRMDKFIQALTEDDIDNLLAYLSVADD